jgi:hypothetical protein
VSKLEYFSRPLVKFDPENKQHRRWYYEFLDYGGWGRCPVRFICPEDSGSDLTVMIRNQLIEYYVHREFANRRVAKLQQSVASHRDVVLSKLNYVATELTKRNKKG